MSQEVDFHTGQFSFLPGPAPAPISQVTRPPVPPRSRDRPVSTATTRIKSTGASSAGQPTFQGQHIDLQSLRSSSLSSQMEIDSSSPVQIKAESPEVVDLVSSLSFPKSIERPLIIYTAQAETLSDTQVASTLNPHLVFDRSSGLVRFPSAPPAPTSAPPPITRQRPGSRPSTGKPRSSISAGNRSTSAVWAAAEQRRMSRMNPKLERTRLRTQAGFLGSDAALMPPGTPLGLDANTAVMAHQASLNALKTGTSCPDYENDETESAFIERLKYVASVGERVARAEMVSCPYLAPSQGGQRVSAAPHHLARTRATLGTSTPGFVPLPPDEEIKPSRLVSAYLAGVERGLGLGPRPQPQPSNGVKVTVIPRPRGVTSQPVPGNPSQRQVFVTPPRFLPRASQPHPPGGALTTYIPAGAPGGLQVVQRSDGQQGVFFVGEPVLMRPMQWIGGVSASGVVSGSSPAKTSMSTMTVAQAARITQQQTQRGGQSYVTASAAVHGAPAPQTHAVSSTHTPTRPAIAGPANVGEVMRVKAAGPYAKTGSPANKPSSTASPAASSKLPTLYAHRPPPPIHRQSSPDIPLAKLGITTPVLSSCLSTQNQRRQSVVGEEVLASRRGKPVSSIVTRK